MPHFANVNKVRIFQLKLISLLSNDLTRYVKKLCQSQGYYQEIDDPPEICND